MQYFLKVFVKHDSWSKGGEGDCISFPITINQPYFTITANEEVPYKSGPINTAKLTQLDLPEDENEQDGYADYFKGIIEPN